MEDGNGRSKTGGYYNLSVRRQHRLGFKRGCSLIAALKANMRTVATGLSEVRNNLESDRPWIGNMRS